MYGFEKHFSATVAVICVMLLIVPSAPVTAQEPKDVLKEQPETEKSDLSLGELLNLDVNLVSATGTLKSVRQAPAVASVITAEDIERTGVATLQEALEMVPGIHVTGMNQNGGTGFSLSAYSVRGVQTNKNPHVLLLINSIPVTGLTSGNRVIRVLPAANISRIEVIRGPGSAVYGADAFSGTINVITKNAKEIDGTRFGFRGGSFDTYNAWGQHGDTLGRWNAALSLEYMETGGDTGRILDTDTQTNFDRKYETSASYAPGSLETDGKILTAHTELAKDNWTLRAMGYWNDSHFGAGGGNALGTKEWSQNAYLAGIAYQNNELADNWNFAANISYLYHDDETMIEIFPAGAILPVGADGNLFTPGGGMVSFPEGVWGGPGRTEQTVAGEFTALYFGFENHFFRIGAGLKHQDVDPKAVANFGAGILDGTEEVVYKNMVSTTGTEYIYMPDCTRNIRFLYLQDEWKFARKWELTAGVRYDYYSDFGNTVNPRLALVWNSTESLTLKLLFGSAFRPPAFAELYAKNNPVVKGNPDLDPETVRTLELAFDYQPVPRLRATFNLFGYKIKDLIEKVRDPETDIGYWQNLRDQEGYGFETEVKAGITKNLRVTANFSYQNAEDADTDETVPHAPGMQAYFNAHWIFLPEWSVDAYMHWIGDRKRPGNDTRPDVDDYATVNLSLRRKNIFRHWDFVVAARNLFDEDIREPAPPIIVNDYPIEGRSFYGELRYHF